jgi:photosystem II stability/assembly factor-like uncharacterized protein
MITQNPFLLVCMLVVLSICSAASLLASDVWEPLGPEGGAISAIVCAKTNAQIIYAAAGDGVYKSINGGRSWQRSCAGLSGPNAYTSLAVDGDTVYVGTSDGVYRSIDAAKTWELCSQELIDVTCLAIAPGEPNVIYAAAGIDQSKIFKSADYGENWLGVDESLGLGHFYSIAVHPQNSDVIYVARENTYIEQNTQSEWKKEDMGLISTGIWCVVMGAIPHTHENVDSRDIYVSTSAGVFKSSDYCNSFSMISSGLPPNITIIAVAQPDVLYAYSPCNGLYRSEDAGNEWHLLTGKLSTLKCLEIASPDTIYAGTQGSGIYKSVDGGRTWETINSGLTNFDVLSFACTLTDDVYVGSKHGGLCKSTDGGNHWRSLRLDGLLVESIIVGQPGVVYANIDNGLYRSINGGNGWQQITTGPDGVITFDLAIHPSNPSTIYAATWGDGAYKSNHGEEWREIDEGLVDKRVSYIQIASSNDEVLYAQTYHGILHSSEDAGETWKRIDSPIAGSETSLLAISPRQPGTIYVKAGNRMFRSVNFGRSFSRVKTPQNSIPLALATDKSRDATLYLGARDPVGGECRIYKTLDSGKTWFPIGSGFLNMIVNTLSIHPVNANIIYTGTSGGLFRLVQQAPERDDGVRISSVINYPNPFASNEGTTFRYTLSHDSFVTIKIFNTAGTFIRTVTEDAARSSGIQEDTWDGRDERGNPVSFGMYVYSITATPMLDQENASTISKVLLVKP